MLVLHSPTTVGSKSTNTVRGNVFSRSSLAEKRVEGIVSSANSFVARHLAIRLDSMLQTVQLPTSISNLNSGLANVDRNTFTLSEDRSALNTTHSFAGAVKTEFTIAFGRLLLVKERERDSPWNSTTSLFPSQDIYPSRSFRTLQNRSM